MLAETVSDTRAAVYRVASCTGAEIDAAASVATLKRQSLRKFSSLHREISLTYPRQVGASYRESTTIDADDVDTA